MDLKINKVNLKNRNDFFKKEDKKDNVVIYYV